MIRTRLFKRTFVVLVVFASLAVFSDVFYLYYSYWWADNVIHFLGGLTAAMLFILISTFYLKASPGLRKCMLLAFIGSLGAGILWELYELYFGLETFHDGMYYFIDTTADILLDMCGGFFGAMYSHLILAKSR